MENHDFNSAGKSKYMSHWWNCRFFYYLFKILKLIYTTFRIKYFMCMSMHMHACVYIHI